MHVDLTAAHWVYLLGVVLIIVTMIMRKNIVVPAVAATFLTAFAYSGDLITALKSIFNGSLVAATNLFNIFLIIALVTALLGALKAVGADRKMVTPFRGVMRGGTSAFWVLAGVTYVISLFFWPTPAVPLVGAVLIPVAIRAGLSPMGVGLVVAIAGQGMALSSDYVIRVAPGLSAAPAGADANVVADRSLVLSLVVGLTALGIAYFAERRKMRAPSDELLLAWEGEGVRARAATATGGTDTPATVDGDGGATGATAVRAMDSGTAGAVRAHGTAGRGSTAGGGYAGDEAGTAGGGTALAQRPDGTSGRPGAGPGEPDDPRFRRWSTILAIAVPVAFFALVGYMILAKASAAVPDLAGGDAAALVGGMAALLLLATALIKDRIRFLDTSATHVVDGLVFAFKAMGIVLPIAGFFFIGNAEFAAPILGLGEGEKAPNLLFELVQAGQDAIPHNDFVTAFGVMIVGVIAGLDGSGFSGLPLTGALSGSLGATVGMDPATLASVGQMGNIWSGGGTLVAWSSLVAVAGFARVNVVELARRCFIPVGTGLVLSTIIAVILF